MVFAVFVFVGGIASVNYAHADTSITSNITTDTTWTASSSIYIIQNSISVTNNATLTIDPGTIIKLKPNVTLTVANGSTLDANGESGNKIYFTSYKDDAVGGDTNGDGGGSSPAAGDWKTIQFNTGSTGNIDHAVLRYSGSSGSQSYLPTEVTLHFQIPRLLHRVRM